MRLRSFLLCALLAARPLTAQQRLTADADVRSAPTGSVVASLKAGTLWTTGATRSGWTALTIAGWVETSRFAGPRERFPQSINPDTDGWRIRADPSLNGAILGEFKGGAGLQVEERRGNWARIRREVWVQSSLLARQAAARPETAGGTTPRAVLPTRAQNAAPGAAGPGAARRGGLRSTVGGTQRAGPGGEEVGTLAAGAVAQPLARDRGWVKVRVEAWVPDSAFVPTDTGYAAELSAADLRLKPLENRGKVLRWQVQVVGLQTADPLRRDLADGEPFLLAVGPRGENAILYVAVPPSLIEQARAIAPMSTVILTARVRNGRSQPTGAPVLDLLSILMK